MYEREVQEMIKAAKEAEKWIMEVYATNFEVEIKSDSSPVTKADKGADEMIRNYLSKIFPDYGFLTEESQDNPSRMEKEYIFIVDPVDGTKEFVSRNGQFTTNIALARNGKVVAGVINIPVLECLYYASLGGGSYLIEEGKEAVKIHVSDRVGSNLRAVRSISFFNEKEKAYYDKITDKIESIEPVGAARKFCLIAEGKADISIRFGSGTKEWDVAAGDMILTEAGGYMLEPPSMEPMRYNRKDVYNRNGYILVNKKENIFD